jgi:ribosomal-protein-alanine N-acetyltransferase
MKKKTSFTHRPMRKKDLPEVLEIERLCFRQPFSQEIFEQELQISAAHLWVVPFRRRVIAYLDFWTVADEMELVSIAVHPDHQGLGVAAYLLRGMVAYAKHHGMRSIVLDVRASNHAALHLYQKFSFHQVGLRKRYYSDNQEDALILRREL